MSQISNPPARSADLTDVLPASLRVESGGVVPPSERAVERPAAFRWMSAADTDSKRLFWLLQYGGWAGYCVIVLAALLGYPDEAVSLLFHRAIYLVCMLGSTFVVRAQCRALWRQRRSWRFALSTLVASAYGLSYSSNLIANLGLLWRWPGHETLSSGFISALASASGCCFLLAWAGVYFAVQQSGNVLRFETLAREAELRALRYQLTPHFLCNTLNGISTLVGENRPQDARRMIARLGDFLRTTLDGGGKPTVALAQEIAYTEQYLAIEQARLGERLRVRISVAPEALDADVPHLLLQPLVENAVQHGIVPYAEGGELTVDVKRAARGVQVIVRNRHGGESRPAAAPTVAGMGLTNTAERLRLAYGAQGIFHCRQDDAVSWTATVEFPYQPWSSSGSPVASETPIEDARVDR